MEEQYIEPKREVRLGDAMESRLALQIISLRPKTMRQQFIDFAVQRINEERFNTAYKPISARAVAMKISHLKSDTDLHFFLKKCQHSNNFSKCFFGLLRPKT